MSSTKPKLIFQKTKKMKIFKIILLLLLTSNLIAQDKERYNDDFLSIAIEMPEMRILYENRDNLLNISASLDKKAGDNYIIEDITLSGNWTRKSEGGYICKPPMGSRGKTVRFMTNVKFKNGDVKTFQSDPYTIKPNPRPNLYWGVASDGSKANIVSKLSVRYENNVPFPPSKGKFEVKSHQIMVSGIKGVLVGPGDKISSKHLEILKLCKKGSKIAISVSYKGTSNGRITAMFVK